jgi:hypothetical protein
MSSLKSEAGSSLEPADPIFKNWKQECEAVHQEMDCLLKAKWTENAADRQVRRMQFMALIERRDSAARNLLRRDIDARSPSRLRRTLEQARIARSDAAEDYARQGLPSSDPNPEPPAPPSPEQAPSASPVDSLAFSALE